MKHLYGGRCTIAIDVVLIVLLAGLGYGPDWLATCVVHCFLLPLLLLLVVIVVVVVKGCAVVVTVAVSFAWLSCSCDCCRVNAANFVLVVLLADLGYGRDWLATMRGALFFLLLLLQWLVVVVVVVVVVVLAKVSPSWLLSRSRLCHVAVTVAVSMPLPLFMQLVGGFGPCDVC